MEVYPEKILIESSVALIGEYNCQLVRPIELTREFITLPLDKGKETILLSLSFKHITKVELFDNSENEGAGLILHINDFMAGKIQDCIEKGGTRFSEFKCPYTRNKFILMDIMNGDPETIKKARAILSQATLFHRNYVIQLMNKSRKRHIDLPVNYLDPISSFQWQTVIKLMNKTLRHECVAYEKGTYKRAIICDRVDTIANGPVEVLETNGRNGVMVDHHYGEGGGGGEAVPNNQFAAMAVAAHPDPSHIVTTTTTATKSPTKLLPDRLLVNPPSALPVPVAAPPQAVQQQQNQRNLRLGYRQSTVHPPTQTQSPHAAQILAPSTVVTTQVPPEQQQQLQNRTITTTVHQGSQSSAIISANYHPNLCTQNEQEQPQPQLHLPIYKVYTPASPVRQSSPMGTIRMTVPAQPIQFSIVQQQLRPVNVLANVLPTTTTTGNQIRPSVCRPNLLSRQRQNQQQQQEGVISQSEIEVPPSTTTISGSTTVSQFISITGMGKAGNKLMPRVLKVQRKNNNNNNNLSPPQTQTSTAIQILPSTSQEQQQPQQSAAPIQQKTTPRGGAVKGTATKREREIHLIDDEETEEAKPTADKRINDTLFSFPPTGRDTCSVHFADLKYLTRNHMLNDTIIDFYMKYIHHSLVPPERRNKIFIFNSFFFGRLTQPPPHGKPTTVVTLPTKLRRIQTNFQKVKNWTKKVNLFDMDYIVVPINEDIHWYLAIVVNVRYGICSHIKKEQIHGENPTARPHLIVLNSLIDPADDKHLSVRDQLGEYLHLEYNEKHTQDKSTYFNKQLLDVVMPAMLPQQKNYIDCGLFLLHFAQLFLMNPPKNITRRSSFRRWYPRFEIKHKRDEIRLVINSLAPHMKKSDFVYVPAPKKKTRGRRSQSDKMQQIIEGMSLMGRTRRYSDSDVDGIAKDEHFSFLYRPRSLDSLVRENREKPVVMQPPTITEMSRFKRMKDRDIF